MTDSIFINQNLDIDNLIFGQSGVANFEKFRTKHRIQFEESCHTSHADAEGIDGKWFAIWDSFIEFENDKLGLKFQFLAEGHSAWNKVVLYSAKFEKYDKLKFYNGITFQSTPKDVIAAFGKPENEWYDDFLSQEILYYSFDKVNIRFAFQNDDLLNIEMYQQKNSQ
jgi:hypothetical protein